MQNNIRSVNWQVTVDVRNADFKKIAMIKTGSVQPVDLTLGKGIVL